MVEADRIVLRELGFEKHVKDWSKFHGILMPILARYKHDQEVIHHSYFGRICKKGCKFILSFFENQGVQNNV